MANREPTDVTQTNFGGLLLGEDPYPHQGESAHRPFWRSPLDGSVRTRGKGGMTPEQQWTPAPFDFAFGCQCCRAASFTHRLSPGLEQAMRQAMACPLCGLRPVCPRCSWSPLPLTTIGGRHPDAGAVWRCCRCMQGSCPIEDERVRSGTDPSLQERNEQYPIHESGTWIATLDAGDNVVKERSGYLSRLDICR